MSEAPALSSDPAPPPLARGFALETDVPCARCSYNLRGLTADMNCPECGTPVSRSSMGNWLRFADPVWVGKLRQGMSLKLWNIAFGLLLGVVAGVFGAVFGGAEVAGMLMALFGGLLGALAVFYITAPEPTVGAVEETVTLRKAIRAAVVAGLAFNVLQQSRVLAGRMPLLILLGLISGATGLVVYVGEMVYLRRFALRIPDATLAGTTGTVLKGHIAATILLMVAGVLVGISLLTSGLPAAFSGSVSVSASSTGVQTATSGTGSPGALAIAAGVLGVLGGIIAVVFGIWYLILVMRYRRAFLAAEKEATALSYSSEPDAVAGGA